MLKRFFMLLFVLSVIAGLLTFQFFRPKQVIAPINLNSYKYSLDNTDYFFNKPASQPDRLKIKIVKSLRVLELYGDEALIGKFKIALGSYPEGDKLKEGDKKTPTGSFNICTRLNKSKYKYFLGISYPNKEDAQRGLNEGIINQNEYDLINKSIDSNQQPPWNTNLGGEIGIHGCNNTSDWTLGCIALSEEDIDVLWSYAQLGTPVEIFE